MPAPLIGAHLNATLAGYPLYLGTIDATTTSKTNHQATTAFNNTGEGLKGKVLAIHNTGSVDVRFTPVATNDGTTSNSRGAGFGYTIPAGASLTFRMGSTYTWIAAIATSSTANVDFFELK